MTDDLFGAYSETDYVVEPRGGEPFKLNVQQKSSDADALFARRDRPSISIITSWNPRSALLPTAENRRRNRLLHSDLMRFRRPVHRATGTSPDGAWQEPGFAVEDISREDLQRIAIAHGQNAVVRIVQGEEAELIPYFDGLKIFEGSPDAFIDLIACVGYAAPDSYPWKRLWELVITLDDEKLELPVLPEPFGYDEFRQLSVDSPDRLRQRFHLHLETIKRSPLHWGLARAYLSNVVLWKHPVTNERMSLVDLRDEADLDFPIVMTRLEFGQYDS